MSLFAYTAFLGAVLLFVVEPLIAKWILPWFGGSSGVWTTCLLAFQALLLAGYLWAAVLARLPPRWSQRLHGSFLLLSLICLPVAPDPSWKPTGSGEPRIGILALLLSTIGLPFVALAATTPLLQRRLFEVQGRPPYRLYAVSNLGSLLALLGYPTLVEPRAAIFLQARAWSAGYGLFVLLCFLCLLRPAAVDRRVPGVPRAPSGPSGRTKLLWVWLAFCPSVLLLAVTNRMTQEVAPVPFLWVLPLSIYLSTFILAFRNDRIAPGTWTRRLFPLAAAGIAASLDVAMPAPIAIGALAAGLFVSAMLCHGELARRRPPAEDLTAFYLAVAFGGALGGAFVAVAAPLLFREFTELPLGLLGATVAVIAALSGEGSSRAERRAARVLGGVLLAAAALVVHEDTAPRDDARVRQRSFYGTLKVRDLGTGPSRARYLFHGTTCHGMQFLDEGRRAAATTYYGPGSGVGLALGRLRALGSIRAGVVGLGAGTLATYARPGDRFRFYEIDPLVVELARTEFGFLAGTSAQVEVVLGDARLALEREAPQGFDLLVADAFSSDSVPVHLLTREAFEIYFRHLRPGGILAVHASNQYLDLVPVVAGAAGRLGREVVVVRNEADPEGGVFASTWVLAAQDGRLLRSLEPPGPGTTLQPAPAGATPWTDGYSDLFRALRW